MAGERSRFTLPTARALFGRRAETAWLHRKLAAIPAAGAAGRDRTAAQRTNTEHARSLCGQTSRLRCGTGSGNTCCGAPDRRLAAGSGTAS